MENITIETSQPGELKKSNWKSILKSALIAGAGAAVAFALPYLDLISWSNFGMYGPALGAIAAFIINFLRLWLSRIDAPVVTE